MTLLDVAAYLADAAILITYALTARRSNPRSIRAFHWANALGCIPIIAVEVLAGAWPPMVLTAAFGLIGLAGVLAPRVDPPALVVTPYVEPENDW